MKKKTIGTISAIMLSAAMLSGCGEQAAEQVTETTAETTQATSETTASSAAGSETTTAAEKSDHDFQLAFYDSCTIYIEGAEIVSYNDDGSADIAIKMNFANKSKEAKTPLYVFVVSAYQDGVECDRAYLSYDDRQIFDTSASFKEVKAGYSNEIWEAFTTYNTESDVVVEIKGFMDFNDRVLASKSYHF